MLEPRTVLIRHSWMYISELPHIKVTIYIHVTICVKNNKKTFTKHFSDVVVCPFQPSSQ